MLQTFDAGSPDTFQPKHRLQLTKSKCKTKSLSNSSFKKTCLYVAMNTMFLLGLYVLWIFF